MSSGSWCRYILSCCFPKSRRGIGAVSKFDIIEEKKFLPIIYENSPGIKLRNLRLEHNITLKELAKHINVSSTTIMHVEQDKIKMPYYYYKIICNHFNVDHIHYLELYRMKQTSILDKLLKIRAYMGAYDWNDVAKFIGYSESFINDLRTRYSGNKENIKRINYALEKLS